MLKLYKLEIFNAVAIEGSFSKAADRMLLSQPAISQHIRDLEGSLQTSLFIRGSRGVKLTTAGETLLDYTRCILQLLDEAENTIYSQKDLENWSLNIGATPGVGLNLLPTWMQRYQERYTGAKIKLKTDTTSVIVQEILSGRLEMSFIEGELKEEAAVRSFQLREIEMQVMVSPSHPWAGSKSISITALQRVPFITRPAGSHTRKWIDHVFEEYQIEPEITAEFDRPEAIIAAVYAGMGVTILPDWGLEQSIDRQLVRLRINETNLTRTLKLVWAAARPIKPAAKAFLSLLVDDFPHLLQLTSGETEQVPIMPKIKQYKASFRCQGE